MSVENPYEDMPSCPEEACDIGGCREPWAEEMSAGNGPRALRLCESHATRWLKAEAELDAELAAVTEAEAKRAAAGALVWRPSRRRMSRVGHSTIARGLAETRARVALLLAEAERNRRRAG